MAVPRASELAAAFSAAFWPVKKRHRRKFETGPCGPQCIQNKESNPGDVKAARNMAGKIKPHGGVETPPYRARERGCSTARSRQDKIARAACRPPLRPNGKQVCRARVLTAPGMRRQAGDLRARQGRAAGSRPRPTGRGNGDAAPGVRGKIKLRGRPAGRPYDLTGIGIYDFVRNLRKVVAPAREGGRGFRTGARMSGSGRHAPGPG